MKKLFSLLCVLSLIFSLSFSSFAISFTEPTDEFFVNDFVNIIDENDESEIMKIGVDLYEQTTAQIVVVTIDSLDGYDVDEYALELGRAWGVGSEEKDNGVVILLSLSDRQISIQVGYGLEGCLNDGKVGRILDNYAIPHLSNNDYSTGLVEAYKAVASVVCEEYGVELNPDYQIDNYADETTFLDDSGEAIGQVMLVVTTIALVLFIIFINKLSGGNSDGSNHTGGSHYGGGRYYGGTTYRGGFTGGSRGGFSGGGGGFRGGGGSFGGGGASRGF